MIHQIEHLIWKRSRRSGYINYVLAQIGEADSLEKLEALLPWNVPLEPIAKKVTQ